MDHKSLNTNLKPQRVITYARAIREATFELMRLDSSVICFGLGVDDPKGIFGTTLDLHKEFGSQRVFDTPTSEAGMTGIAIGASLQGIKPIMTHQRLDFFLLTMDQLVNNAAKWRYMFGGKRSANITIRCILGRGWGQGPTHSQNLQAWFAHIPGLKVLMPTFADDAKGLLMSAVRDENPVLILEHRWLYETSGHVPEGDYRVPIGKARKVRSGKDISIVAMSYMTLEAVKACDYLIQQGIQPDLIDLRTISPLDFESISESVKKTGRLLVLDTANATCSVAHDILAKVSQNLFSYLKIAPQTITLPDFPSPTSPALSEVYYKKAEDIIEKVGQMLGKNLSADTIRSERKHPHDVPGDWFKGPF